MKKQEELLANIVKYEPDIVGISEALPKNARVPVQLCELNIHGYDIFCSLDSARRGVCIYIKIHLKAVPKDILAGTDTEAVWCEIKL